MALVDQLPSAPLSGTGRSGPPVIGSRPLALGSSCPPLAPVSLWPLAGPWVPYPVPLLGALPHPLAPGSPLLPLLGSGHFAPSGIDSPSLALGSSYPRLVLGSPPLLSLSGALPWPSWPLAPLPQPRSLRSRLPSSSSGSLAPCSPWP